MVTKSDYDNAFKLYKDSALLNDSVIDVIWYGNVSSPGVSDIDVILVIKKWSCFRPSFKLLNPEMLSPLFTHGPLICEKKQLNPLLQLTTVSPDVEKNETEELVYMVIRQTFYLIHFYNLRNVKSRNFLLLGKSLLHSFADMKNSGVVYNSQIVNSFYKSLHNARKSAEINNSIDLKLLRKEFDNLVLHGISILANILRNKVLVNNLYKIKSDDCGLLLWFSAEIKKQNLHEAINPNVITPVKKWTSHYNNILKNYLNSGIFWKGGEFWFINLDLNLVMGRKKWIRRFIKLTSVSFRKINSMFIK